MCVCLHAISVNPHGISEKGKKFGPYHSVCSRICKNQLNEVCVTAAVSTDIINPYPVKLTHTRTHTCTHTELDYRELPG